MFITKHHYAINLAKRGNKVFFLNPPTNRQFNFFSKIKIINSENQQNLYIIHHSTFYPSFIRFHFPLLYKIFSRIHLNLIIKKINKSLNVVWSFDLAALYPFNFFPNSCIKIFHPVDEPNEKMADKISKGADIILSVTNEILEKFKHTQIPTYFINHSIDEVFLCEVDIEKESVQPIRVGISGNLLRPDLDRPTLLDIISTNNEIIFEIWGPYEKKQSNIGGEDDVSIKHFINKLKSFRNVILHGVANPEQLAAGLHRMDAFLICYNVEKDQSKGTNYHKIIEYLSSGKVIISNNITTYQRFPELVQMVSERESNHNLPGLFKDVISNINLHNTPNLQKIRIEFSKSHAYNKQIDTIEILLGKSQPEFPVRSESEQMLF